MHNAQWAWQCKVLTRGLRFTSVCVSKWLEGASLWCRLFGLHPLLSLPDSHLLRQFCSINLVNKSAYHIIWVPNLAMPSVEHPHMQVSMQSWTWVNNTVICKEHVQVAASPSSSWDHTVKHHKDLCCALLSKQKHHIMPRYCCLHRKLSGFAGGSMCFFRCNIQLLYVTCIWVVHEWL